jgi:phospholipid-binding lipoprotein MlaA
MALMMGGPDMAAAADGAAEVKTDADAFADEDFFDDEFGSGSGGAPTVSDPLAPFNKAMFRFNDKLYFWVLKPAATGYKTVTPTFVRTGLRNFFHNLTTPVRVVNCMLQGKSEAMGAEIGRFMLNTTVGVLGFGNPAQRDPRLSVPDEDLGQTLAVWGIGNGPYIVWPVLGPSTLRDAVGRFGDGNLNPVSYITPLEWELGTRALDTLNDTSFRLGDYESLKESAIAPYEALRDAYIQNRKKKIEE